MSARDPRALAELVSGFAGKRILVHGDLVADEFVFTTEPRVSREAPVLILEYADSHVVPGGAANAAMNIAALGGTPVILGEVGDDDTGRELLGQLEAVGADTQGVLVRQGSFTPRKSRILAGDRNVTVQQVVRIDRLPGPSQDPGRAALVAERVGAALADVQGVIISDYGLGFVQPSEVSELILRSEHRAHFKVALDSRYRLMDYVGVDVTTPSETELEAAVRTELRAAPQREEAARQALKDLEAEAIVLTRGSQGMELLERETTTRVIPAFGEDTVTDVTGAGDTVIATLSLALAVGAPHAEAAELANAAAGLVVTKLGTATVSPQELRQALLATAS